MRVTEVASQNGDGSGRREWAWLAAIFLLALVLRLENAAVSSLHLDDFHSLDHARTEGLGAFFHHLAEDNHPPLSFLVLKGVRTVFGEGELALRLPAILYGVLAVGLVRRLGRRLECPVSKNFAAAFLAASSLHMVISSDLRMYSLLALAVAGLLGALTDVLETGRGKLRAVAWLFVGVHTHYHFLHVLVVLTLVVGFLLTRKAYRSRFKDLALVAFGGLLLALPWYSWGFPKQLAHDLAPGGSSVSAMKLAEGMVHLVYLNLSIAGPVWRALFLLAGAITVLASLYGARELVRAGRERGTFAFAALVLGGAYLLPLWTAVISWFLPRAGFEWRYLAGAVVPFVLLVGAAARPGPLQALRRGALLYAVLAAAVLAAFNARDAGLEDYRSGVLSILNRARPGDAIVAADWQPDIFPHSVGWSYYSERLADEDTHLPEYLPHTDVFSLPLEVDLSQHDRVFVLLRSIPNEVALLDQLRKVYPREESEVFGGAIYLLTFERDA